MNKPRTSDKIVVGSRVAADNSIDEEDIEIESALLIDERSETNEAGAIFCIVVVFVIVAN